MSDWICDCVPDHEANDGYSYVKRRSEMKEKINQKINNLACRLYQLCLKKFSKNGFGTEQMRDDFKLLYPAKQYEAQLKQYYINKIKLCLYYLIGSGLLILVLWIKEQNAQVIGDNLLYRNQYGDGDAQVELVLTKDQEKIPLQLHIQEREYTKAELDELYETFLEHLDAKMLGENVSLRQIRKNLNLVDEIEGFPFHIDWYTDTAYIDETGELQEDNIDLVVQTTLRAEIYCQTYSWEKSYELQIAELAQNKDTATKLGQYLTKLEESTRTENAITLPETYEDSPIQWKKKITRESLILFAVAPFVLVLILYCQDYDLHEKVKRRQEQLDYDYPEIVNKMMLYTGAGMTIENAWKRMIKDYQNRNQEKRFVYEEMLYAYREVENGMGFDKALEIFGKRCQSAKYMKFVTLLCQHVKKGSLPLASLLRQETAEAMEDRKSIVRKRGEKAGTKMLMPMMLLLFVVMILIIAPAFISQMRSV